MVVFPTLALSAGCGQPAVTAEEALELEAADSSPDLQLSSERWMVVQAPERRLFLAAVVEPQGRGAMLVSCETQSDTLVASFVLLDPVPDHLSGHSVDLWLDGGGFASPDWTPRHQDSDRVSAFDIVYDKDYYTYADGFWHHIDNLMKHDRVTAVVKEGKKEIVRLSFSLAEAKPTINRVVQRCGFSKRP